MRLQLFPAVKIVYPNDVVDVEAQWEPPFAGWHTVGNSGDIGSDFSLAVDAGQSFTNANGAHRLYSGNGFIEFKIDDQFRPTSTGLFWFRGAITDVNGLVYLYKVEITATQIVIKDEANNTLTTISYSTVSGDVYRMELNAGFRLYRNGSLLHSRTGLGTQIAYPMSYTASLDKPVATNPARITPPRLVGDWRLGPLVTWTAPSHGSISTTGPAIKTRYSGGTVPGDYTLVGQVEPAADANLVQLATAKIKIPPLFALGPTEIILDPGAKIRPKTNYDEAQNDLVAWTQPVGAGSFSQGEYTAGSAPGPAILRATASVNSQVADIIATVPPVITAPYLAAAPSESVDFDTNLQLRPVFVSAGAPAEGTGNITPGLPPGMAEKDVMWLYVESANEAVSTPSGGWAAGPNSPQGTGTAAGATSTRLTAFWKRVGPVPANEVAPQITDPGDHAFAVIVAYRGCIDTGDPWDVANGDVAAGATTAVSIPGATTTVPNCLVVVAVANQTDTATPQVSGYANSDLTNLTERFDGNSTQGNGGGIAIADGRKDSFGTYGATTATLATSSVQGRISIALKPAVAVWSASSGSINSSSGIWDSPSQAGQTARISVTNGTYTVIRAFDVLEKFPRSDFILPWPIDFAKRVLLSESEDGSRTSRIKSGPKRSFPVSLLVDGVADLNGAGLSTIRAFWDRHHPGKRFIMDDPEEALRLVVYSDSDLRWEHTGAGINIAFRVKEA